MDAAWEAYLWDNAERYCKEVLAGPCETGWDGKVDVELTYIDNPCKDDTNWQCSESDDPDYILF